MKLNMQMIFHALNYKDKYLYGNRSLDFSLTGMRFFDQTPNVCDRYLYIVSPSHLKEALTNYPDCFFLCSSQEWDSTFSSEGNVIIIIGDYSLQEIALHISEVCEEYQQWDTDLSTALIEKRPLSEILYIGIRFLKNPVGLFDKTGGLILLSGEINNGPSNTWWENIAHTGYSPAMDVEETRKIVEKMQNSSTPFFVQTKDPKYAHLHQLACPLHHDGIHFANLGTQDYHEPLTWFDYSVFAFLKSRLEFALYHEESYREALEGLSSAVVRLLQGDDVSDEALQRIALSWNHKPDEPCFIITFENNSFRYTKNKRNIQTLLPKSILLSFENHIIAVNYDIDSLSNKKFIIQLEQYAGRTETRIGISSLLSGFSQLQIGYAQCCLALNSPSSSVQTFSKAYIPYLAQQIRNSPYTPALQYPGIEKLFQDNPDYGTELLESLRTYLMNGGNLSNTAVTLSIHRHTAQYRIDKIEQLLQINLSQLSESERIQLYLSCLVFNR